MLGLHAIVCTSALVGVASSGFVGEVVTNQVTHAVVSRASAGSAGAIAALAGYAVLASLVLWFRNRPVSLAAGLIMALPLLLLPFAVGAAMCGWSISFEAWWQTVTQLRTELWPRQVVRSASMVCLFSGPLVLLVHAVAWSAEDALLECAAGPVRPAAAAGS